MCLGTCRYPEIDVLALNSFGKSALTSAFKTNNKEFVNIILSHESAAPLDQSRPKESVAPRRDVAATHQMVFQSPDDANTAGTATSEPLIHIRERAIDRNNIFGKEMQASEDVTGLALWPASIILAYWIADERLRPLFRGRRVLELGAGCGLPGIVAAAYARARALNTFAHSLSCEKKH